MWDALFFFLTLVCFASGVLYVRACVGLKGERDRA
jgi:hypothetical protein